MVAVVAEYRSDLEQLKQYPGQMRKLRRWRHCKLSTGHRNFPLRGWLAPSRFESRNKKSVTRVFLAAEGKY